MEEVALGISGIDPQARITVTAASFSGSRYRAGTPVSVATISGHRDVDYTDCPGDAAYRLLKQLRADVATDLIAMHNPFGAFDQATRKGLNAELKGWAVDRAARLLQESGLEEFAVSAGGDMRVVGRAWR